MSTTTVQQTSQVQPPTQLKRYRAQLPPAMAEWRGNKIEAWMCVAVTESSYKRLKRKKIKIAKWARGAIRLFKWRGGLYYVDAKCIFLWDRYPVLMYDVDVSEALSLTDATIAHKPINPRLMPHFSQTLEYLVQRKGLEQMMLSIQDTASKFNSFTIIMLALGLAIGMMIGYVLGQTHLITGPVTTVTTTTSSHT